MRQNHQSVENYVIEGVKKIRSLCDEVMNEIKSSSSLTPRVSDILAEEIPELSESLFGIILNRSNSSVFNCNKPHVDEIY